MTIRPPQPAIGQPSKHLVRDRLLVTTAAVVWIAGTLLGSGWLGGGGVESQGDGLFSDNATLIAPMGPAFSIWSMIYIGLLGYVIWQWLPGSATSEWARMSRLPAAVAIALNGVWLLIVFAGWVGVSVLVILGIAAALGVLLRRTADLRSESWAVQVWVAATFGLYLGWVCVATAANITAALKAAGFSGWGIPGVLWAVAVLSIAGLVGAGLAVAGRGRLSPTLSLCWGLAWITVSRVTGTLPSTPVAITASAWAAFVAVTTILIRLRHRPSAADKEKPLIL